MTERVSLKRLFTSDEVTVIQRLCIAQDIGNNIPSKVSNMWKCVCDALYNVSLTAIVKIYTRHLEDN